MRGVAAVNWVGMDSAATIRLGKEPLTTPPGIRTTTDAGAPAESDEHSLTIGPDGPILLQDHYLIEQMANFNRERIPERQPHAKGGGAFGYFEVTGDVSPYTRATVFQPGVRTDTLIRFSTVAGERGSPDTWRDPRGFALKFYTADGNYDMVANNTPVFFLRDPLKFQHFIRSQKRRLDNNLRDHDMQWDFWSLSPESAHQVTWLMGDRGIPRSWRHMNGYSSHTYLWYNAAGGAPSVTGATSTRTSATGSRPPSGPARPARRGTLTFSVVRLSRRGLRLGRGRGRRASRWPVRWWGRRSAGGPGRRGT